VKLIEHYASYGRKRTIREQTPREDTFREEAQVRAGTGDFFETDLISHRLSHRLTSDPGNEAGRETRGQAARLQHQHLAIYQIEKRGRHARSLPGAGRRFDH
jgi:hypothetical protein